MNISSLTVRTRLTLGFGVVCVLMLVILGVGLFSVNRVNDVVRVIVDDRVPKIDAVTTIEIQANLQSVALRDMLLASDAAERRTFGEAVAQARDVAGKNLELLQRLIVQPKGEQLL